MSDCSGICSRLAQVLTCLASLALAGCASTDTNVAMTTEPVTPIVSGEPADVSAYDLAEAMLRAGFTREQILLHGPTVRQSLATHGGAQVRDGKVVGALFSIHAKKLYVTSRTRGTFVQPLRPAGTGDAT